MLGIAVDIDGTLVDEAGDLYPATAETLARYWPGARVILASARPPQGIRYILERLGLDGPYIALNGGIISPGKGQPPLVGNPIPAAVFTSVCGVTLSKKSIKALFIYGAEEWFAWGDAAVIAQEKALTSAAPTIVQDLAGFRPAGVVKLLVACGGKASWIQTSELLSGRFGGICTVRRSRPCYVEITATDVTKGVALENCRRLFHLEKCVAIGDGLNDLDMFKAADISYATPEAPSELKKQATYVLEPPHDDSLAELFLRLLTGTKK